MPEPIDPRKEFSAALIQFSQAILYMLNRQRELKHRSADLLVAKVIPGFPAPMTGDKPPRLPPPSTRHPDDEDDFEKETRARVIELGEQIREAWRHVRDCLDEVKKTAFVPADVEGVSGGQWRLTLLGEVDEVAEIVGGQLLAPSKEEREAKERAGEPVYTIAKLEWPSEKEREHLIFMLDRLSKRYVRDIRNQLIAPPAPAADPLPAKAEATAAPNPLPPAVETPTPKANGAGKRGRPGITPEEEALRLELAQEWDQAAAAGVTRKEFCEDKGISEKKLTIALNWRNMRGKRKKHKIPPQEK